MNALLILFGIESAADAWTTFQGIKLGCKEVWIPKFLFSITGVYWGLLLTKVCIVAAIWYWLPFTVGQMKIVDLAYIGLIAWNWTQLQKQKALNKQ